MSIRRTCLLVSLAAACNNPTPQPEASEVPVVEPRPAPPPPPMPLPLATQLSLSRDGDDFLVVRDAQALVDAGVPWREMIARAKTDEPSANLEQALGVFTALSKLGEGDEPPLKRGGFALRGGLVLTESKDGAQLIFAADKPELAAIYLTTLPVPGSDRFACATEEWLPPMIACSTKPLRRSGPASDGAARLRALRSALPVDPAEMDLLFGSPREAVYGAARVGPGRFEVHLSGLSHPLLDAAALLFAAGPATQLRFVQPGVSFAWARLDPQRVTPLLPPPREGLSGLVQAFSASWTGEVVVGGSRAPAGIQVRAGLSDAGPVQQWFKDSPANRSAGLTFRPDEIPGLRVAMGASTVRIGGESTTLLRLQTSGAPYYDSVASVLGLSQAAGVFAAERSLALALGFLPAETPAPATAAAVLDALPPGAAADLRADAVLAIAHFEFDVAQSPAMATALDAISPLAVSSQLRELKVQNQQTALLSSLTIWVTRPGPVPIWHAVLELIGHTADDEGRAALAAVDAATSSGGPAAAFAALAERYPNSHNIESYRIRAGAGGQAALAGSPLDVLLLVGTLFDDE
jgi:hypothetical protein